MTSKRTKNPLAIPTGNPGKKLLDYDLKTLISNLANRKIDPKKIPELFPVYLLQQGTKVPTMASFALFLGISAANLSILAGKNEQVEQIIDYLNTISEDMLFQGGLTDSYNSSFAQFILKTKHGYIDKSQTPTMQIQANWFNLDERGYAALDAVIKTPTKKPDTK